MQDYRETGLATVMTPKGHEVDLFKKSKVLETENDDALKLSDLKDSDASDISSSHGAK